VKHVTYHVADRLAVNRTRDGAAGFLAKRVALPLEQVDRFREVGGANVFGQRRVLTLEG